MEKAGINAGVAKVDVQNYTNAVKDNGAKSQAAQNAREKLVSDILNAGNNAKNGQTDLANFTNAVKNQGAQSAAAQGARAQLIKDLENAGLSSKAATSLVNGLQGAINGLHGKTVTLSVNTGPLASGVSYAQGIVDQLTGKTVNITDLYTTVKKASGGIIGAAGGGPRSNWVTVGEHGAELVKLPGGSTVVPNGQSMQMLNNGGSTANVQLEVSSSGSSEFENFMLYAIRNWVRVKGGGNVQKAFGRS